MPSNHTHGEAAPRQVDRREFLKHVGRGGAGATVLLAGAGRARPASAQSSTSYPDWIPMSTKPPKRGGILTRASSWDPPVLDPRLTQSIGLFQFAGLTSNRLVRYVFARRGERHQRSDPEGRPRGVVAVEPRQSGVDVQAAPGGQVAERARRSTAASWWRRTSSTASRPTRRRGCSRSTFGDRGDGDARQAHAARAPQHAQRAVPAEPRRARHGDLRPRGPGGGRRPQEAPDRHRALHPQGAHPQGAGGAGAEPRLLRQGPPVPRRVRHPLHAGCRDPPGRLPHGAERHPVGGQPVRGGDGPQDEQRRRRARRTRTCWRPSA